MDIYFGRFEFEMKKPALLRYSFFHLISFCEHFLIYFFPFSGYLLRLVSSSIRDALECLIGDVIRAFWSLVNVSWSSSYLNVLIFMGNSSRICFLEFHTGHVWYAPFRSWLRILLTVSSRLEWWLLNLDFWYELPIFLCECCGLY